MTLKAFTNIQIFGAGILLKQLGVLLQEVEGVRKSEDIECVHRMRVASRRIRSGLPVFAQAIGRKKADGWRMHIRGITRALGDARDTDVQIESVASFMENLSLQERAGVRRLVLRLTQKRNRLQKNVLKALEKFEASGVVHDMAVKLAPMDIFKDSLDLKDRDLLTLSAESINKTLLVLISFEDAVQDPNNIAELHAMRIAAKQFRYTMEIFAPLYKNELKQPIKAARGCQDLLGEIHDCDVWNDLLPKFTEEEKWRTLDYIGYLRPYYRLLPGINAFADSRRDIRKKQYKAFIESWKTLAQQGIWEELQQTIAVPDEHPPQEVIEEVLEEPLLEQDEMLEEELPEESHDQAEIIDEQVDGINHE